MIATRGEVEGLDLGRFEEHCLDELRRWTVPGIEVIAIKGGEVLFAGGFGRRRLDPDQPVTDETVFAHGSTGKAFTAFLVATLVDDGLLAWDAPVREYLPSLRLSDPTVADRVTLRDLLSHRSGLPRHDLAWIANPSLPRQELVARLRHLPLSKDLRQACQYSNLGYVLAGHVVEVVTGSTYEDQLRARVFEPLGFQRTYTDSRAVRELEDHAEPYMEKDGAAIPIPGRGIDNAAPAGGIMSCARDTARWLRLQLGGGELEGRRVLSEAAFRQTHSLQIPMPFQSEDEFQVSGYALGWCVGTYRGRRLVWHNGGIDGFYTEFMLLPDEGIAVGTCNNAGRAISQAVARHVADLLLGVEPRDWTSQLLEQEEKAKSEASSREPATVAGTSPSHPLADFAATYSHPGYGDLRVEMRDGGLGVRVGELELDAAHRHYDTWDLSLRTLADVKISATFYTDPSGQVSDVFLPLEASVEPIRFRRKAEAELSDPDFLARLAGTYEAGPARLEISLTAQGRLQVTQDGQQAQLEPAGSLAFTLAEMPGVRLQFVLDGAGRAKAINTEGATLTRIGGS